MIRCMDSNHSLRKELDRLLSGKGAHADFDAAVDGLSPQSARREAAGFHA